MNLIKKLFVFTVIFSTVLTLSGFSFNVASAANLSAGMLVKRPDMQAVYYLYDDAGTLKRATFPNSATYFTWFKDFSSVVTVTADELGNIPLGKNVVYRPGTRLIKITTDPKVYAIEKGGILRWIDSEATAKNLWGNNWASWIDDMPDAFYAGNYNSTNAVSNKITTAHPAGSLIKYTGSNSIYYVVGNGSKRLVTEAGFTANKFNEDFVIEGVADTVSYTNGTDVTTSETDLFPIAEGGASGPTITGNLSVGLSGLNPASTVLGSSTIFNNVLTIAVSASDGDVNLKGLTITKAGLVANTKITGISIWDDQGLRHGSIMSSLTSEGKVTVSFEGNPIVIPSGTTKNVYVKANFASDATSGTVQFRIGAAADINSTGVISGSFPISGNMHSLADAASAGAFTLANVNVTGITDGNQTTDSGNVNIGDTQREVMKFQVTETSGNEDMKLYQVTAYLEGSVQDTDLGNWKLYDVAGTVLATAATAHDRYVTFNLDTPYTIPQGNNKTFTVKTDILNGSTRYFRIHVQNDYDVLVKGVSTGFYKSPTGFADAYTTNGWFKMRAGTVNLTKAATSASGNVLAAATNVELAKFDIKAEGEGLEIRKINVKVPVTGGNGYFLAGTLRIQDANSGETFLSTTASSTNVNAGHQFDLSSYINLSAGQTKTIKVVADISSNATTEKYTVSLKDFYAKRLSTNDYTTLATTYIPANELTVSTASVAVNKNSSMQNMNISSGGTAVRLGSYTFQSANGTTANISSIGIDFSGSTATPSEDLANLKLKVGNNWYSYSGSISNGTSANTIYTNGLTISDSGTVVDVYADIIDSAIPSGRVFVTRVPASSVTGTGNNGQALPTATPVGNVTGQAIQIAASTLTITKKTSEDTNSRILSPEMSKAPISKLEFKVGSSDLDLEKLTFTVSSTNANARNYTKLYFTSADNSISKEASFSGSDAVVNIGTGTNAIKLLANGTYYFYVKVDTNVSGFMLGGSVDAIGLKSTSTDDMIVRDNTGSQSATTITAANNYALSNYMVFHDANPVMSISSGQPTGSLNAAADVAKVSITNPGKVTLNVNKLKVSANTSGLGATGAISAFKLYRGSTLLASSASLPLTSTSGELDYEFDLTADPLTVTPGETVVLTVKANTTQATSGKTSGTVNLFTAIKSNQGYLVADDDTLYNGEEPYWYESNIQYKYLPSGASTQLPASNYYSAHDSSDLNLNTITWSL